MSTYIDWIHCQHEQIVCKKHWRVRIFIKTNREQFSDDKNHDFITFSMKTPDEIRRNWKISNSLNMRKAGREKKWQIKQTEMQVIKKNLNRKLYFLFLYYFFKNKIFSHLIPENPNRKQSFSIESFCQRIIEKENKV